MFNTSLEGVLTVVSALGAAFLLATGVGAGWLLLHPNDFKTKLGVTPESGKQCAWFVLGVSAVAFLLVGLTLLGL